MRVFEQESGVCAPDDAGTEIVGDVSDTSGCLLPCRWGAAGSEGRARAEKGRGLDPGWG